MNKERVRAYLKTSCTGRQYAKTQDDIALATNLSPLEVRLEIRRMRLSEDILIISTPQNPPGYYIPGPTDSEVARKQIENLKLHAIHIMELLKPMMSAYNKMFPNSQMELDLK